MTLDAGPVVEELCCLAVREGPTQPLSSLVVVCHTVDIQCYEHLFCPQYLTETVLVGTRVSAMSVGLACLTSSADLAPSLLPSLSPYLPFTFHADPKLKSCSAKVTTGSVQVVSV